ncbi:MAG: class IIb bacteriocin, lactobin A/cerein 7B family [Paracoccus sp. (in: a-proteobacteria)]|uniref:class IIb bacteriocin, lactobin A/cerein 7B family n=1 Tax=Paracoccus sp. TaxID=267 RepID=UPI0026E098CC|nr:class IIb bacteriocin, lactobin A/cerein 7B family [Paracoccus sp. (in: a-proteobacteria)]MDO5613986.1 class IIb bacteriocin, lactobin A/cerein 7B family [Paracoccus sp. (in: a-proteobacteria)]
MYDKYKEDQALCVEMNDDAIEQVSGAALPVAWAIGLGLSAVFGGGFTAGYTFGKDLANRGRR